MMNISVQVDSALWFSCISKVFRALKRTLCKLDGGASVDTQFSLFIQTRSAGARFSFTQHKTFASLPRNFKARKIGPINSTAKLASRPPNLALTPFSTKEKKRGGRRGSG